ncbi:MAG: cytochrome C biogenesis protein ResB [Chthoniobacterales bacterium]
MSVVAEPPERKVSPEVLRKRMIAERQKKSAIWKMIHILASLKLALLLLATLAIACATATFYESGFSSKIARSYIYDAPWFTFWLAVLCVNLFSVTLSRWPWQKKHAGFIVTHYGIICLLIGAMVGHKYGFEGNVTIHKNRPPLNRIVTNRSALQVQSPADNALYLLPFDAEMPVPTEAHPRILDIPGSRLKLVVDAFNNNMQRRPQLVEVPDGSAGILLKLQSTMVGRTMEMPLLLEPESARSQDFFGMAKIALAADLPKEVASHPIETQMVFSKFASVIHSEGTATQIKIVLSKDGKEITVAAPDGTGATYHREEAMNQAIVSGGTSVVVRQYWPDFEMRDGKPFSRSDKPNNPAVVVEISTTAAQTENSNKPALTLSRLPNGKVAYQISRSGAVYAKGEAAPGESFQLGWADWSATIEQSLGHAQSSEVMEPGKSLPANEKEGIPGFRSYLLNPDHQKSAAQWLDSGGSNTLTLDGQVVTFSYGLETRPIPFTIGLLKFDVPRDEGTETPSNFIATVEFKDAKNGATKVETTRMNHPASFPGLWWNTLTGINYKFSQAEWNPQDLDETTLQVLYDPGWLFKWMGSLGICMGIAIMFYWKPFKS